jgi:hypothetical protein
MNPCTKSMPMRFTVSSEELILDLLGDDPEIQAARQIDHRRDHRLIDRVDGQIADEGAVDLQVVHRQGRSVANELKPLPKSSSANSQPMPCSTCDEAARVIEVRDHRALGDLEADVARRSRPCGRSSRPRTREIRIRERLPRDVDRDAAARRQLQPPRPSAESTACTTQRSTSGISR